MKTIEFLDLGRMDYRPTWELQQAIQSRIIREKLDERAAGEPIARSSDILLFVEHPHVFTLGKSGKQAHLLASEEQLSALDAQYVPIDRGGDITYHGPGQIVGYPILDLDRHFTDIHRYLRTLEEMAIRTCADFGIQAGRIEGLTGVWVGDEKICAFGVKCSRWVTLHGFAFNVSPDLHYFDVIVPCGIRDHGVTSLEKLLGQKPDIEIVKERLKHHFSELFGSKLLSVADVPERSALTADFK